MIALGKYDQDIQGSALDDYKALVKKLTVVEGGAWEKHLRDEGGWVEYSAVDAAEPMTVKETQQFLRDSGFFPHGRIDGICGYRTSSAIRLFQEYLRTVEGVAEIGYPDGIFGQKSAGHASRWQAENRKSDWTGISGATPTDECARWLSILQSHKDRAGADTAGVFAKVKAHPSPGDTVKPADWDFDGRRIHLIGIRRKKGSQDAPGVQVLNDLFVLLINGLTFKFYGSTEPGTKESTKGYPFLVPGQHRYRFGWHKITDMKKVYHALKPGTDKGVLIVRSKNLIPTEADLAGPLERNISINIHWGGEGESDKAGWSAGCQVVAGRSYTNHTDQAINCIKFAAPGYAQLGTKIEGVRQTKGAYTVLEDLVAALSGASPDDNIVHYTLLREEDLGSTGVADQVERLKNC
ncbi:MAG: hypothetical protein IPM66_24865 [Acidobacteriota bacterium]|nr:MAG: hypothetical protein IPM66_24865 [Acidobacteriota bacterium]